MQQQRTLLGLPLDAPAAPCAVTWPDRCPLCGRITSLYLDPDTGACQMCGFPITHDVPIYSRPLLAGVIVLGNGLLPGS